MKSNIEKLKIALIMLSIVFAIGACVTSEPLRLTLLPPASVSATFGGVTISTASTGASGVFVEEGNVVVIRGFPNPPDELGVPDGEITVVAPAGVAVSTLSLSFSDLAGTDAGQQVLTETVTVSSEGNADNTFSVRIDFVAGTPALVIRNSGGFDGIDNNRLNLAKGSVAAESTGMVSPCVYYAPDITFMLGTNVASTNYRVVSAIDPRPVVSPYFDSTDAANNTNAERFQVTYETNTGALMFGFSVVIQDCIGPTQIFTSPGNTGSEPNPWIITDANTLQAMAFFVNQNPSAALATHFFELANDVDLADFGGSEGFTPIGVPYHAIPGANEANNRNFAGSLDCKGRTISNLTINRPSSDFQGLFAFTFEKNGINGFIRNCRLTNVNVVGRDGVGGLIGDATSAIEISNVHLQGSVRGRNLVGGLVGRSDGNVMLNAKNTSVHATVSGAFMVGGMMGFARRAVIDSSYFNGTVSGELAVGGLLGYTYISGGPTIKNSYARGTVTGFSAVGGLVGFDRPRSGSRITNNLSLMTVAGSDLDAAVIDLYRTDSQPQPSFERLETFRYHEISTPIIEKFDATPSVRPIGAFIGDNNPALSLGNLDKNYADSTLTEGLPLVFGMDALAGITGFTTEQLQSATAPGTAAAEPYNGFDTAVWDFGTVIQYPALNPPTDGVFTLEEQRTP